MSWSRTPPDREGWWKYQSDDGYEMVVRFEINEQGKLWGVPGAYPETFENCWWDGPIEWGSPPRIIAGQIPTLALGGKKP